MPQCYKSEGNRPIILVNNTRAQLSLKTGEGGARVAVHTDEERTSLLAFSLVSPVLPGPACPDSHTRRPIRPQPAHTPTPHTGE